MGRFRTTSVSRRERFEGKHRFEHWYRDNTVYFVTSRVEDKQHAFKDPRAQAIFWSALDKWSREYGLALWVVTLMSNHYHLVFYLRFGENFGPFMQKLHGSIAKQVNDLRADPIKPFWAWKGRQTYFDGCLRDEPQIRRTYRYVLHQSERAKLTRDWRTYPNTRVWIELEIGVQRAKELNVFLPGVPYKRYGG